MAVLEVKPTVAQQPTFLRQTPHSRRKAPSLHRSVPIGNHSWQLWGHEWHCNSLVLHVSQSSASGHRHGSVLPLKIWKSDAVNISAFVSLTISLSPKPARLRPEERTRCNPKGLLSATEISLGHVTRIAQPSTNRNTSHYHGWLFLCRS